MIRADAQSEQEASEAWRYSLNAVASAPLGSEATTEEQAMTAISETFAVILDDGKALVVSQSADPYTDRRVRVEVKATILK